MPSRLTIATALPATWERRSMGSMSPSDDAVTKQTYTYKTVGTLEIRADVYRAGGARAATRDGLDSWRGPDQRQSRRDRRTAQGCDAQDRDTSSSRSITRLAPKRSCPRSSPISTEGLSWVHDRGPELFGRQGQSPGGGRRLGRKIPRRSRPVSAPGPSARGSGRRSGDTANWSALRVVQQTPVRTQHHNGEKITREEARAGPRPGNFRQSRPARATAAASSTTIAGRRALGPRRFPVGIRTRSQPEKFAPYMPLENVNEEDSPPTLLIHGQDDTDVPYAGIAC